MHELTKGSVSEVRHGGIQADMREDGEKKEEEVRNKKEDMDGTRNQ